MTYYSGRAVRQFATVTVKGEATYRNASGQHVRFFCAEDLYLVVAAPTQPLFPFGRSRSAC